MDSSTAQIDSRRSFRTRAWPLPKPALGTLAVLVGAVWSLGLSGQVKLSLPNAAAWHQVPDTGLTQKPAAPFPHPEGSVAQTPVPSVQRVSEAQHAQPARVSWNGHGLFIEASNASLVAVLHQVAAATGLSVEGSVPDQRIFGTFGPGPGCEVLSSLFDGSGLNVAILGSENGEVPLRVLLSARPTAKRSAGSLRPEPEEQQNAAEREHPEPDPQPNLPVTPVPAALNQNPFSNGEPARDPIQFMDEILQRQQVIDEQQPPKRDQP